MYKKVIKITDYNGQEREETLYFNFNKAELMKKELSTTAGVEEKIKMLIATKDNAEIVRIFDDLILDSYGIKSEDGTRFIKNAKLREDFQNSEAYSEFFMLILSDPNEQAAFINGVINGVNLPEMKEEDAIAKLKELGYDTSTIEASLNRDKERNIVYLNDYAENHNNT